VTAQEVVLDLLRFVGVTGFAPPQNEQRLNRPGLDDDDVRKALAAVNTGLSTIREHGPQSMKQGERAAYFGAPIQLVSTSIAPTGMSATLPAPPPAWILGCSAMLEADGELNRVRDIVGNEVSLLRGYRGGLPAPKLTVYFDCALLGDDIAKVLEPVTGAPPDVEVELTDDYRRFNETQRRMWSPSNAVVDVPPRQPGSPRLALVERRRNGELFLRVTPMPGAPYNLTFQAELNPEQIDEDALDLTGASDPGYEFESLRANEVTSLLLPLARWEFFQHPALKNNESRQTVKLAYDRVMQKLTYGNPFESSVPSSRAKYV
jgi:hypothetical protein